MTTPTDKSARAPREWWLAKAGCIAYTRADRPKGHRESYYTRVIEFAAYERLLAQCEKLAAALEAAEENFCRLEYDSLIAGKGSGIIPAFKEKIYNVLEAYAEWKRGRE